VTTWAPRFAAKKYPEDVYWALLSEGGALSDHDIDILGAWKDGACRMDDKGSRRFGGLAIRLTNTWGPKAASCAFDAWRALPQRRAWLLRCLDRGEHAAFLQYVAALTYKKAGQSGALSATFGLSRASHVSTSLAKENS
jgi:hypothetical protein